MKSLKVFIINLVLLILSTQASASIVKGVLKNGQHKPVKDAWVTLIDDNTVVSKGFTDAQGNFNLEIDRSGTATLLVCTPRLTRNAQADLHPDQRLVLTMDFETQQLIVNSNRALNPNTLSRPAPVSQPGREETEMTFEAPAHTEVKHIKKINPASVPVSDGFDFPIGDGSPQGYYVARDFTTKGHLGEDWNGRGGGNTDLGDPVLSVANGLVVSAMDIGGGWGNVVRVIHNAGTRSHPKWIETVYAHLDRIDVRAGQRVYRGKQVGTIGNAEGRYLAHLHFEMRDKPGMSLGGGYGDREGYIDPSQFIQQNRP